MYESYYCRNCGNTFDYPQRAIDVGNLEHFGERCSIYIEVCPYCKEADYIDNIICDYCLKSIEDENAYSKLEDGSIICNRCKSTEYED